MKTQFIKNTIYALPGNLFFFCMSMAFTALLSCNNEDVEPDLALEEKETAQFELVEDYYFDDAEDIAMEAFIGEQETGGRSSTDSRLTGALLSRTESFLTGTLRIDFDGTSMDARGNVRKGAIIVQHAGRWDQEGAEWTIQFVDYFINGIKVEGSRKVTVATVTATVITHDVMLLAGKIIWPDGRIATREFHHTREYHRNGNQLLDRLIIYGNAQGTCRNGRGFSIEILEPLVYDRGCADAGVFITVEGKKLIKHGDRELTIDYGNGSCDNVVTLTNKSGLSTRYEVKK